MFLWISTFVSHSSSSSASTIMKAQISFFPFFIFFILLLNHLALSEISENKSKNFTDLNDHNDEREIENTFLDDNSDNDMKLICYYGSWAVYRPGRGKFPVEEIDPFLCSHIIYGFAGLSYDNKIRPLDPYNDLKENWGKGAYLRFTGLKKINKKLKTLIAIGGWNEGSVKYSNMASNPETRKIFVQSVVEFLERYNFDGLDFDWEYPGSRGGKPEDKRNFVALLRELKEAFEPRGYLLTSAVSAGKHTIDPAYDIPQVAKYLDIINVMCYDYHGGWESKTGHNAPLYPRPNEPDDNMLNVNFSINYWISKGAPREKIVLGMGTYGRSFTLRRAEDNEIGAHAPQKGQAGPYTREAGSLGYNEICEFRMKNPKIQTVWNPYHMAPYSYWDRQWVGYDDIRSIAIKSQYAKAMGLGGGMIWSIETDDFGGHCGDGKYPLLNTIKRVFRSNKPVSLPMPDDEIPSTPRPTPSTTVTPTSITSRRTSATPSTTRCTRTTTRSTTPITTTTSRTTTRSTPFITTSRATTRMSTTPTSWIPSSTSGITTPFPSTKWTILTSTTRRPNDVSTASSNGWWSSSSPWWPTKPTSDVTPSSEVWWSSTFSTVSRRKNPNSIEATVEKTTSKNPIVHAKKSFTCVEEGLFRNPETCTKFIRCVETKIEGQFQLFFYECPDKTVFNNVSKLCDWIENVPECMNQVPQYFFRGFNFQNNFNNGN